MYYKPISCACADRHKFPYYNWVYTIYLDLDERLASLCSTKLWVYYHLFIYFIIIYSYLIPLLSCRVKRAAIYTVTICVIWIICIAVNYLTSTLTKYSHNSSDFRGDLEHSDWATTIYLHNAQVLGVWNPN